MSAMITAVRTVMAIDPYAHHRAFAVSRVSFWITTFSRRCISIWYVREGMLGSLAISSSSLRPASPCTLRTFAASTSRRNCS